MHELSLVAAQQSLQLLAEREDLLSGQSGRGRFRLDPDPPEDTTLKAERLAGLTAGVPTLPVPYRQKARPNGVPGKIQNTSMVLMFEYRKQHSKPFRSSMLYHYTILHYAPLGVAHILRVMCPRVPDYSSIQLHLDVCRRYRLRYGAEIIPKQLDTSYIYLLGPRIEGY